MAGGHSGARWPGGGRGRRHAQKVQDVQEVQ